MAFDANNGDELLSVGKFVGVDGLELGDPARLGVAGLGEAASI